MTKYLSDCHGAETTLYTSLTDASVSIRRCNKCGQPCTIHEVKEEPKEGHTLAGHMKSILKMATIKEEPMKEGKSELPSCGICGKPVSDKDFTYDGEEIVVHRHCIPPQEVGASEITEKELPSDDVLEEQIKAIFCTTEMTQYQKGRMQGRFDGAKEMREKAIPIIAKLREEIERHLKHIENLRGERNLCYSECNTLKSQLNEKTREGYTEKEAQDYAFELLKEMRRECSNWQKRGLTISDIGIAQFIKPLPPKQGREGREVELDADFETQLYKLVNRYVEAGLKKPDLIHKMEYVTESCRVS